MKKKISFLVSLMLVVTAGFYFAPEYSNAGDDDKACCIQGQTGQAGDSITITFGGIVVSTCISQGQNGNFTCCGLDPRAAYTIGVYRGNPSVGCSTGAGGVTCKDYMDFSGPGVIWDCW